MVSFMAQDYLPAFWFSDPLFLLQVLFSSDCYFRLLLHEVFKLVALFVTNLKRFFLSCRGLDLSPSLCRCSPTQQTAHEASPCLRIVSSC